MKSSLNAFSQKLDEMIALADKMDIPFRHLYKYRKELDRFIKQRYCTHAKISAKTTGNTRIWKCEICGKIIDYETIG